MCRNVDENIKSKRDPKEVEADMFAAYLLMPSKEVRSSFFRMNNKPFDLSKKRFLDLFRKLDSFLYSIKVAWLGFFMDIQVISLLSSEQKYLTHLRE